jgi:HTH-type transcriptional regulator/antitoxin HigA
VSTDLQITNERDLKQARRQLAQLRDYLSSDSLFDQLQNGTAPEIIEAQRLSASDSVAEIERSINSFLTIKGSNQAIFSEFSIEELGKLPIVARLMHGHSQEEFAKVIGLKQQQLQKYEAEEFSSMKLSSFINLLKALGGQIDCVRIEKDNFKPSKLRAEINPKILRYIEEQGWFPESDNIKAQVQSLCNHFSKSLRGQTYFRQTKQEDQENTSDEQVIWLARVAKLADDIRSPNLRKFNFLDLSYLPALLSMSRQNDGPSCAIEFLKELGIITVVEPNLPSLKLDGAAFLLNQTPVIGLTLRYDRIDNFWFTLLHELGHIHLHQTKGLAAGFVDNFDVLPTSEVEQEADRFALETVMPIEKWRLSPARLANKPDPVIRLAKILNIHEAIIFGRIRKERGYNLFNEYVGQGEVRKHFDSAKVQ